MKQELRTNDYFGATCHTFEVFEVDENGNDSLLIGLDYQGSPTNRDTVFRIEVLDTNHIDITVDELLALKKILNSEKFSYLEEELRNVNKS